MTASTELATSGVELFVRVLDPQTGVVGFLPIEPAIRPDSSMRFHRGRPPHNATVLGGEKENEDGR